MTSMMLIYGLECPCTRLDHRPSVQVLYPVHEMRIVCCRFGEVFDTIFSDAGCPPALGACTVE